MEMLKFYAKTASTSLLRWLMLAGGGLLICLMGIVVSLRLLSNNAAASGIAGLGSAFLHEFWSSALLLGSLALIAIYVVLANKITLAFTLFRLFENQLAPLIGEKVATLLAKGIARQPGLSKSLSNVAALRGKLDTLASEDGTVNRIQRKAIHYGLTQARLEDINFQQDDLNLPLVISGRVVQALQAAAEPTYQAFWIVVSAHTALFALALFFDHA